MISSPAPGLSSSNTPKVVQFSENSLNKMNTLCSIFSPPHTKQEQSREMQVQKKVSLTLSYFSLTLRQTCKFEGSISRIKHRAYETLFPLLFLIKVNFLREQVCTAITSQKLIILLG